MSKKKILLLIHKRPQAAEVDPNWELFRDTLINSFDDSTGIDVTIGALADLVFDASPDGLRVYDPALGFSLDEFDLVVFRIIRSNWARVSACCSLLQHKGIPYIDTAYQPRGVSKYASEFMRYTGGLPIIRTLYASNEALGILFADDKEPPMPFPMIVKDVNGRKGRLNFLAHNSSQVHEILEQNPEVEFVIQEFIPNDGDYRFLIMGQEVVLVIHRQAQDGSHLNNTSQGAIPKLIDVASFDDVVVKDALKAASIESIEVAGVDVMFDRRNGQHHIIEVNSSPQLLTGAFPELKMKAYAKYLKSLSGVEGLQNQ